MRRLIIVLFCLAGLAGLSTAPAVASHGPASGKVGATWSASWHHRQSALDRGWDVVVPVVLAPAPRAPTPNSSQNHPGGPFAVTSAPSVTIIPANGCEADRRHAGWGALTRGYRATGPPDPVSICLSRYSLARPA
ncbi:MAG TPA: hypothetical protein VIC03_00080 [Gemmatimonadaceae bacterium]